MIHLPTMPSTATPRGRFAPSPTGRMHLGNMFTALISWLDVKSRGGDWVVRIEDLDPQRSKQEWALLIDDDLRWLGLIPDEGSVADTGKHGPYRQSLRGDLYEQALDRLKASGMVYPCRCTRAELMASSAPHASDGRVIYPGTCRPASLPQPWSEPASRAAVRVAVDNTSIAFTDAIAGPQEVNLARECGDFIVRRADGAWAYQLAVVVDDAMMGITRVVRGNDLLISAAQQTHLYRLMGWEPPQWVHVPLVVNAAGRRLSKRDTSLSMEALRARFTPEQLTGILAHMARLRPSAAAVSPAELLEDFSIEAITREPTVTAPMD